MPVLPRLTAAEILYFCVFLVLSGVLLGIAGWHHVREVNPDAVAYIRIAQYYGLGDWPLAVSGYWGPLYSWLMMPFLWAGLSPFAAARAAMAVSGAIYVTGCWAAYTVVIADTRVRWILLVATALFVIPWSVELISPDLLLGGTILCGFGLFWRAGTRTAALFAAGVLFGLAYLSKSVALPACALAVAALLGLRAWRAGEIATSIRVGAAVAAGTLLVALPWILVLSSHYGYLTFSTSAPINHSLVGESPDAKYHYFVRTYHDVPPGRVTTWEDPDSSVYALWSPLQGRDALQRQVKVIVENLVSVTTTLKSFDRFGLIFAAAVLACVWPPRQIAQIPWRESAVVALLLSAIYLPVYAGDPRYFLPAVPLMLGCAVMLFVLSPEVSRRLRVALFTVLMVSFVASYAVRLGRAFKAPASTPLDVAETVRSALAGQPRGYLLSTGPENSPGFQAAYYGAMLLGWQYGGNTISPPGIDVLRGRRGSYVFVEKGSTLDQDLRNASGVTLVTSLRNDGTDLNLYRL